MNYLLSSSDLDSLSRAFEQNLNPETLSELEVFLASDELRFLPFKTFLCAAKQGNAEWAVRVYLNQQDKLDRQNGKFHAWMLRMCNVTE